MANKVTYNGSATPPPSANPNKNAISYGTTTGAPVGLSGMSPNIIASPTKVNTATAPQAPAPPAPPPPPEYKFQEQANPYANYDVTQQQWYKDQQGNINQFGNTWEDRQKSAFATASNQARAAAANMSGAGFSAIGNMAGSGSRQSLMNTQMLMDRTQGDFQDKLAGMRAALGDRAMQDTQRAEGLGNEISRYNMQGQNEAGQYNRNLRDYYAGLDKQQGYELDKIAAMNPAPETPTSQGAGGASGEAIDRGIQSSGYSVDDWTKETTANGFNDYGPDFTRFILSRMYADGSIPKPYKVHEQMKKLTPTQKTELEAAYRRGERA